MACEIKLNGIKVDSAFLNNLLARAANDVNFRNAIILDNYIRLTKDEAEIDTVVLDYLKTTFGLNDTELRKAIQAEQARREATNQINLREKARASVVLNNTKESLKKAKNFARRLFSNKGIWGVFDKKFSGKFKNGQILRDGTVNMWITKAHRLTEILQQEIDSIGKYLTDDDRVAILNVLNGKGWNTVPFSKLVGDPQKRRAIVNRLSPIVKEMRSHVDEGTNKIVGMSHLVTKLQALLFLDNQGKYTTILYEAHRNPNWAQMFQRVGGKYVGGEFAEQIFNGARDNVRNYISHEKGLLERLYRIKQKSKNTLSTKLAGQTDPKDRAVTESMIDKLDKDLSNIENRIKAISNALSDEELLHIEVFNTLEDMYKNQSLTNVSTSGGYRGAMNKAVFRKRQNIPADIMKLYGKIEDPGLVYQATISKMASIIANAEYQKNMFDINNDMLKSYREAKARGEKNPIMPLFSTSPLADVGVIYKLNLADSFSVLSDFIGSKEVYVSEEMKEFFSENNFGQSMSAFMQVLTAVNAAAKINATVLNLPTQERNFIANLWKLSSVVLVEAFSRGRATALKQFATSLGQRFANEGKNTARLLQVRKGAVRYNNDYERLEFIMTQQGLKNSDIIQAGLSEEVKNLEGWGDVIKAMFYGVKGGKGIYGVLNPALKSTIGLAKRMYAASDDIAKEALFRSELENYSDVYYGKTYKELLASGTPEQISSVENTAGAIVRDIIPNYNNAWELSKILQKSGLSIVLSPFGIFRMEQMRTMAETVNIATKEMRNNDPDPVKRKKIRRIGIERMMGFTALIAVSSYSVISALDGGDEEDEEFARKYLSKNVEVPYVTRNDNGKLQVMDMSNINVYGSIGMADRYLLFELTSEDKDVANKALINLFSKLIAPIVAPQLGVATLSSVIQGKDQWGRDLFEENDSTFTKLWKIAGQFTSNVFVPGSAKALMKMSEDKSEIALREEEIQMMRLKKMDPELISFAEADLQNFKESAEMYRDAFWKGINPRQYDPSVQAYDVFYNFKQSKADYDTQYQKLATKLEYKKKSGERETLFAELQSDYFDQLDKMRDYYEAAKSIGFDPIDVLKKGPIRKGISNIADQKTGLSGDEIKYITGDTNVKPNLKITLHTKYLEELELLSK